MSMHDDAADLKLRALGIDPATINWHGYERDWLLTVWEENWIDGANQDELAEILADPDEDIAADVEGFAHQLRETDDTAAGCGCALDEA